MTVDAELAALLLVVGESFPREAGTRMGVGVGKGGAGSSGTALCRGAPKLFDDLC